MLYWAAVFFVIAIVAAIFGFGGIAAGAAGIAKVLFVVLMQAGAKARAIVDVEFIRPTFAEGLQSLVMRLPQYTLR